MSKSQKKIAAPDVKPLVKVAKGKAAEKSAKLAKPEKSEAIKKPVSIKELGRSNSKQSALITLLKRSGGATVEEMAKATGWQNHSVLGAVSGVLRKRLGLTVTSNKEERGRVYRITENR